MITLGLNSDHDIFIDPSGNLARSTDIAAIEQDCQTAMSTAMGEMVLSMDKGLPYFSAVWDNYSAAAFEAAGRVAIGAVSGVKRIDTFTISKSGDVLSYRAVIVTIYGIGTVSNA